ncbi:hypothetical protein ACFLWS_00305 [Chloroflexota bacterium]
MGETPESLAGRLLDYWDVVAANTDIAIKQVAEQALIAPARCCLKNIGQVGASNDVATTTGQSSCLIQPEEQLVETAFEYLKIVSQTLKGEFNFPEA